MCHRFLILMRKMTKSNVEHQARGVVFLMRASEREKQNNQSFCINIVIVDAAEKPRVAEVVKTKSR